MEKSRKGENERRKKNRKEVKMVRSMERKERIE